MNIIQYLLLGKSIRNQLLIQRIFLRHGQKKIVIEKMMRGKQSFFKIHRIDNDVQFFVHDPVFQLQRRCLLNINGDARIKRGERRNDGQNDFRQKKIGGAQPERTCLQGR